MPNIEQLKHWRRHDRVVNIIITLEFRIDAKEMEIKSCREVAIVDRPAVVENNEDFVGHEDTD